MDLTWYGRRLSTDEFNQESRDEAETPRACCQNLGVTFTMLAPLSVTGTTAYH